MGIVWPVRLTEIDISSDAVRRQYAAYAPPVINRLRPTAVLKLDAGEETGTAALFYATSPSKPRLYGLTATGPGTFFIGGDEPAWLGIAETTRRFVFGPVTADAKMLWLTKTTAAAQGLTRLALDGKVLLSSDIPLDAEWDLARGTCELKLERAAAVEVASRGALSLAAAGHRLEGLPTAAPAVLRRLAAILDRPVSAPASGTAADDPLSPALNAPALPAAAEPFPGAAVHDLKVVDAGGGAPVLAAFEDGRVVRADRSGRLRWEFRTGGPVHALDCAVLRPGVPAVLAGSDDEYLYALDFETGGKLWEHRAEVYPETALYPWWTLDGKAKVRSILAADFDGDGRTEIAIGTGGMQVEMVDANGSLRWRRAVKYGLPVRLLALPPAPGRPPDLLAGLDFLPSQAGLFRFRGDGVMESADAFPSGREGWDYTGVSALAVLDHPEAEGTILAVGRSGAFNEVEFYDTLSARSLGKVQVGDTVSGVVGMRGAEGPLFVCGTEAGWVLAILPEGRVRWSVPLPEPVLRLWRCGATSVGAWCGSRTYYILDVAGAILASGHGSWPAAFLATSTF